MTAQVTIDERFRGPPESANGGYACGVVAGLVGGTAAVTLRRPPPLNRPLGVEFSDGRVVLRDAETVIAEGAPAAVEIEPPAPVTLEEAEKASKSYLGLRGHPFPTCFTCGPQRAEGDGLRVFPGAVAGRDLVAAPWTPHESLAGEQGLVRPEFVWAALDCPGGWSLFNDRHEGRPVVLGGMAATVLAPARPGERCVVVGWPLGEDGRKLYCGPALFSQDGELGAVARATWVRID